MNVFENIRLFQQLRKNSQMYLQIITHVFFIHFCLNRSIFIFTKSIVDDSSLYMLLLTMLFVRSNAIPSPTQNRSNSVNTCSILCST